MIKNISWENYFLFLTLTLIAYYAFILLLFYKIEIMQFIKGSKFEQESPYSKYPEQLIEESDQDLFPVVHILMGELHHLIEFARSQKKSKEEILISFKSKLVSYPDLHGTPFHHAINKFLKAECIKQCSILFSEEELGVLWNKQ